MRKSTNKSGILAAAIIGLSLIGVSMASQEAVENQQASLPAGQALIAQKDAAAREQEAAVLKMYEQADFDFMRGDAELPEE